MNWGQYFNSDMLVNLVLPIVIGLAIIAALYFLRWYAYRYVHKMTARTTTSFGDILIHETRIATLLWCIWLGVLVTYKIARTPPAWVAIENKVIPVLFTAIGIYTVITVVMPVFKWYITEICSRTIGNVDNIIMSILIIGTPVLGGVLGIILILNMLGVGSAAVNSWVSLHLAKLAFLIILAIVLLLIITVSVPKAVERAVYNNKHGQSEEELKKRADTLVSVIVTTIQIVIIFIFLLMVMSELTINIAAFLTGAGVLGIAIGLGAQTLVKDLLAGVFIIMENQYRKGDVVKIANITGVVEEINLRRTILRDLDGITHIVPNGQITVASNFTKLWSRVNLNISVSYNTDLDKAMAVINRVGKEIAEDPQWAPAILTPPKVLRIDNLGDSGIDIKILGETKPIHQWEVMGELRLRLKKEFDKEGIEIPWPHTKVYFGNQLEQLTSQNGEAAGRNIKQ